MPKLSEDDESPTITLREDILPESVPFVDEHDDESSSSSSSSSSSPIKNKITKNIIPTSLAAAAAGTTITTKSRAESERNGGRFSDAFPWVSSPQADKLRKFASMFQLNTVFGHLGRCIAITPTAFFISAIIIGFTTVGMYRMHLRDRVRDGYTPTTSPSRYETDVLRNFFGLKSDPTITLVILYAKDGGTMHRPEHLAEALRVHNHIRKHVNVTFDGSTFAFNDFCGAFCETGYFFQYFAESLIEVGSGKSSELFRPWSRLDFPISKVHGIDFHFERNLFGVKTAPKNNFSTADYNGNRKDLEAIHNITNIRYIELIQLMYHGETIKGLDEEKLAEWELQLYKYAREEFWSNLINMEVLGSEIVDHEMNKDSQMMGPYVGLGVALMLGFACFSMIAGSYYFGFLTYEVLALAFVSTFGSLLSVGTTLGIYGFTQMRVNSVLLILPFLTLGIGVNDSFMLAHAHFRHQSTSPNVKIHMQRILSEVGPSITITSLTNVVTFLIGAWTPTAEIKLFCFGAAIALGYSYVFTIIFFCPTLVYVYNANLKSKIVGGNNVEGSEPALRRFMKKVMTTISSTYTYLVCCKYFQLLNVCIFLTYLLFGIYGTINITAKLDTEKILPAKSVIRKPHELIAHKIWVEYYPMQLFITEPFDLANESQMKDFNDMMNEFYNLPQNKGRKYTISWFDDYKKYFDESSDDFNFDFHSDTGVSEDLGPIPKTGYDLRYMKSFLSNPIYEHYHTTLRLNNETKDWKEMKIEKFTLTLVFYGIDDWQGRIDIMVKWRQIAKKYSRLGAIVWETNAMFVDQMLTMKTFSLQSAALTLACMFVVCAIFIQTPLGVGVAVLSIGSISFGVVGYLYFWGLDLDPASLCAILMSVGMSVDFTAHTIYSYLNREKEIYQNGEKIIIRMETESERVSNCIHQVMYPMTLGGISTVLCVLPLMIFSDYVPLVFFKTVILVVIFGFYHGVVVLPVVLVLLTPPVERLSKAMKKKFFKRQNIAFIAEDSLQQQQKRSIEMDSI